MFGVLHRHHSTSCHQGMLHQAVLNLHGKHLGAVVADNHAFLAADHEDVTFVVQIAYIARVEPKVAIGMGLDKLLGGLLVLVIAEDFNSDRTQISSSKVLTS